MDEFTQIQQLKNAELVKKDLLLDFPPLFQDFEDEDFSLCPECQKYVPARELKTDVICWHCIRKGL